MVDCEAEFESSCSNCTVFQICQVVLLPEIAVARASDQVKSLTSDSALTSEPRELNRGAHVAQPTRAMDMLVSGAV